MQMAAELRNPDRIQPPHEAYDGDKLADLVTSMRANGWQGAPVVTIAGRDHGWGEGDPIAVTGSHRIAAAQQAGIDIPVVDLDTLLHEHGTSLAEVDEETGTDPDDERHTEAVTRLDYYLPADIVEYYGLDAH